MRILKKEEYISKLTYCMDMALREETRPIGAKAVAVANKARKAAILNIFVYEIIEQVFREIWRTPEDFASKSHATETYMLSVDVYPKPWFQQILSIDSTINYQRTKSQI